MSAFKDITGREYQWLTAVRRVKSGLGRLKWEWRCRCGATCVATQNLVCMGGKNSCGCKPKRKRKLRSYCKLGHSLKEASIAINGGGHKYRVCLICRREYLKDWYQKNKKHITDVTRKWRQKHLDKVKNASAKYYRSAKGKQWYEKYKTTAEYKRAVKCSSYRLPLTVSDELLSLFETNNRLRKELYEYNERKRNAPRVGGRNLQAAQRQEQAGSRKRHIKGSGNDMRVNPG